ncbi:histidine kinase dimerization/phosphoacceptor domain -containing protein [Flavobacterium sp.]|uniref:histidine kinase dimerization/phosphoacceptor domain -containing protein n=1 Tax=Flavobacterium sp. TaxID=239 RepID=UPI003751D37A
MKKILFISLLFFSKVFCQNNTLINNEIILKSSKIYLSKAMWFQNMPQYDNDSSTYYFEKSCKLLKKNSSFFNQELAYIYLQRTDFSNINSSYSTLDSLANIGWSYLKKNPKKIENRQLEYDYLTNWSFIKLENGNNKQALKLFSKAISLANDFKTNEQKAKVFADKGNFYQRYKLPNEQKFALSYLSKSLAYYERNGIEKKPLELFLVYRGLLSYHTDKNIDSLFYYSAKMQTLLKYIKKPQKHAWYYVTYGRDLITYPLNGDKKISVEQYKKGKENIIKALEILEKYNINKNTIKPYAFGLLADLYMNEKKYDLAITNYKKSNKGYSLLKNRKGAEDMNFYIAKAYHRKGELATALIYYERYYKESINFEKEINQRSLRENELQVNLLQQDKEIAIQKTKISQNKLIQLLGLSIVSLLVGLLIFGYKIYRNRNRSNQLLAIKNAENELLLKEIHHRVKNNLEVVSSLLALHSAQIEDQNIKDAMTEGQNRINSIGIVHQKLYQGSNLGAVEMKDYFLNLSESILDSFGAEQRIELQLAMEKIDLDIDTAVPLGLIVNELLTNTIKYAFPKGEKGTITIKLHKQSNNILQLVVSDNGIGKSGVTNRIGFGGQLISLLTQQLNGTIKEENLNGTKLVFDFKMKAA